MRSTPHSLEHWKRYLLGIITESLYAAVLLALAALISVGVMGK